MGRLTLLAIASLVIFASCKKNQTGEFTCTCTDGATVLETKFIKDSNFEEANWECKNLRVKYSVRPGATCGLYD